MTQPCMGCTKYKKEEMHHKRAFPLFIYPFTLPTHHFSPQPVIKIFRFDIEQIVMERAYNKIRCMQQ